MSLPVFLKVHSGLNLVFGAMISLFAGVCDINSHPSPTDIGPGVGVWVYVAVGTLMMIVSVAVGVSVGVLVGEGVTDTGSVAAAQRSF